MTCEYCQTRFRFDVDDVIQTGKFFVVECPQCMTEIEVTGIPRLWQDTANAKKQDISPFTKVRK